MPKYFYLLFFSLVLSACSFSCCETRRAACNEIKSRLIFNGATSNTRQAEIERSSNGLSQCAYMANHCDQL